MERWTNIKGYEGLYLISDLGNVKSLRNNKTRKEKILRLIRINSGYLIVCLSKNGERKNYYVHRLVAEAFLPNPKNYPEVNHKDENKSNNCVDNLEWCDRQYNIDYSKAKQVGQYDLKGNLIRTWKSAKEIQRRLGFDQSNISKCCRGEYKQSHGYTWKYC